MNVENTVNSLMITGLVQEVEEKLVTNYVPHVSVNSILHLLDANVVIQL